MLENKRENIHFTTVSPGRIQTNISLSALKADGSSHEVMDDGQKKGIPAEVCARKIIHGILNNKRKVYVIQAEMLLIATRKVFPPLYFWLVKTLKLQ
jgi:short-subunit dehydrogenase